MTPPFPLVGHTTSVYLEAGDLAQLLHVSRVTVSRMVKAGRLVPAATTRRGVALFTPEQADAVCAERTARRTRLAA